MIQRRHSANITSGDGGLKTCKSLGMGHLCEDTCVGENGTNTCRGTGNDTTCIGWWHGCLAPATCVGDQPDYMDGENCRCTCAEVGIPSCEEIGYHDLCDINCGANKCRGTGECNGW